ncbi:hypothetical protein LXL04_008933 [Taraxacum kok-saghyz]
MRKKRSLGRPTGGGTSGHRNTTNHFPSGWNWQNQKEEYLKANNNGQSRWKFTETTSFFISNLPIDWEVPQMPRVLEKLGTLIDLFVVGWKDKYGNRFGFARYNRVEDTAEMVNKIKRTTMGRNKIYAREAKFERKAKGKIPSSTAKNQHGKGKAGYHPTLNQNKVSPNLSFKDVCKGSQNPIIKTKINDSHNMESIRETFQTFDITNGGNRKEELTSKLVGELIHYKAVSHISTVIAGEGYPDDIIDYLGDFWILLSPRTDEEREKILNNSNLKAWFKTLKPWDENFNINNRITWITIEGLPVNYWNIDVLVQIGRQWGEVLISDLCKFGLADISQSRVCVRTQISDLIMGSGIVNIEDKKIKIRFMETKGENALNPLNLLQKYKQTSNQGNYDSSDDDSNQGDFSDGESQAPGNISDSEDEESEFVANTYFGSPETNGNNCNQFYGDNEKENTEKNEYNGQKEENPNDPIPSSTNYPTPTNTISSSTNYPPTTNTLNDKAQSNNTVNNPNYNQLNKEKTIPNFYNKISSKLVGKIDRSWRKLWNSSCKVEQGILFTGIQKWRNFGPIMNILSLNINGLGRGDYKVPLIKKVVDKHRIDFLGLQETKRRNISDMILKNIWGTHDFEAVTKDALGQGGGLISMWNNNLFQKTQTIVREDCIIIRGIWLETGEHMNIINVYASQNPEHRKEHHDFLNAFLSDCRGKNIIFGDFNEVRFDNERRGSAFDSRGAEYFNRFIRNNDLEDLKISGCEFTWSNKQGTKLSKLDRFLVSREVSLDWSNMDIEAAPRSLSDHNPLILKHKFHNYGPTPFKFYNSWMKEPDIEDIISNSWNSVSKPIDSREAKNKILEEIKAIDKKIEQGTATDAEIEDRNQKSSNLGKMELKDNEDYKQLNKNKWNLEWDENTKLFHRNINRKKRKNGIKGILKDNTWINEPKDVKQTFFNHFSNRFRAEDISEWRQDLRGLNKLSSDQANNLEAPFEDLEIKEAVWSCAYDSMAWEYLEEIMTEMGFGVRWRKWMRVSLSSGFSSILINGSPTDEFKLERGLRQGDPLSPFLFTLIMEGLSLAIKNSETLFGFKGINIGKNNVYLSHLFFADDAVFLAKCSIENALNLIRILFCFKHVSGLTVSMEKSKLFGVGITEEELSAMAQIMGCSHDKLPTTFLGIPLGVNMKRVNSWKPLIDKFNKKMSIWKRKTLSIGGRHTIVSNILGNMGNYWFSLFPVPATVIKHLEGLRRDFFWGYGSDQKYIPWVKWQEACKDKKYGGLGIGELDIINKGLLGKWIWRFRKEKSALWVKIISSIHGADGGLLEDKNHSYQGSIWKNIINSFDSLNSQNLNPISLIKIRIGNGLKTHFWTDKWCCDDTLASIFPRLYALEENKEVKVADRIGPSIEVWQRRRQPRGGREEEELDQLKNVIGDLSLSNREDDWFIPSAPGLRYTTRWLREEMAKKRYTPTATTFRWKKRIQTKTNVFMCRLFKDRLPVKTVLFNIGAQIPDQTCVFCHSENETLNHIFLDCELARYVWLRLGLWWQTSIPIFLSMDQVWSWIEGFDNRRKICDSLWILVIASLKALWDARNDKLYKSNVRSKELIFKGAQDMAFNWLNSEGGYGLVYKGQLDDGQIRAAKIRFLSLKINPDLFSLSSVDYKAWCDFPEVRKRTKVIEEFQMKYESALTKLRGLGVQQDVLATVQIIELRPRIKVKRRVKKKVVFNLENNVVHNIHDDLHDDLYVSEKNMSPDVVEGESSGSENGENVKYESEGMVAYRKPILQDLQKYETQSWNQTNVYVPKPYGVQIPKCDLHFRNTNSYLNPRNSQKKKKKRKVKKIWVPKVKDIHVVEKVQKIELVKECETLKKSENACEKACLEKWKPSTSVLIACTSEDDTAFEFLRNFAMTRKVFMFCERGRDVISRGSFDLRSDDFRNEATKVLEWRQRHAIAIGTTKGLRFLHEDCRSSPIIHRDLRPSNILLTHDFVPMLGDFGLAKWKTNDFPIQTRILGTLGYLAPEYAENGMVSVRTDVYAYGITLIQIISGRKAVTVDTKDHHESLIQWVEPLVERLALHDLIDPRLGDSYDPYELYHMAKTAYLCVKVDPEQRPSMGEVVQLLEGETDHFKILTDQFIQHFNH